MRRRLRGQHYICTLLVCLGFGAACASPAAADVAWAACATIPKYPNAKTYDYFVEPHTGPQDIELQGSTDSLDVIRAWYTANLPGWRSEDHTGGEVYPPFVKFYKPNTHLVVVLYPGRPITIRFECRPGYLMN